MRSTSAGSVVGTQQLEVLLNPFIYFYARLAHALHDADFSTGPPDVQGEHKSAHA
jgi:hypothetical protein